MVRRTLFVDQCAYRGIRCQSHPKKKYGYQLVPENPIIRPVLATSRSTRLTEFCLSTLINTNNRLAHQHGFGPALMGVAGQDHVDPRHECPPSAFHIKPFVAQANDQLGPLARTSSYHFLHTLARITKRVIRGTSSREVWQSAYRNGLPITAT